MWVTSHCTCSLVPRLLLNVNLCTPWVLAQLQCSHSGAGEPGNEVTIHLYIHTCTFKHVKYSLLNHSHLWASMSCSLCECRLVSEPPQDVWLVPEGPNTKRGWACGCQLPSHWVAASMTCKIKITHDHKHLLMLHCGLMFFHIWWYICISYLYLLCPPEQTKQQEW